MAERPYYLRPDYPAVAHSDQKNRDLSWPVIALVVFLLHALLPWVIHLSHPEPKKPMRQKVLVQTVQLQPQLSQELISQAPPPKTPANPQLPPKIPEFIPAPPKKEEPKPVLETPPLTAPISEPKPQMIQESPKEESVPIPEVILEKTPQAIPKEEPKALHSATPLPKKEAPQKPAPKKTPVKKPPAKNENSVIPAKKPVPPPQKKNTPPPKEDKTQSAAKEAEKKQQLELKAKQEAEKKEREAKKKQEELAKKEAEKKRRLEIEAENERKRQEENAKMAAAHSLLSEALAKNKENRDKGNSASQVNLQMTSLPTTIDQLNIDHLKLSIVSAGNWTAKEINYRDEIAQMMQSCLRLPEFGSVQIELTIHKSGKVEKVKILSSESSKNKQYIEQKVSGLKFPSFGNRFQENSECTFTVNLKNERKK